MKTKNMNARVKAKATASQMGKLAAAVAAIGGAMCTDVSGADALIDSWYVKDSGKYARIYPALVNEQSGDAVTTWSRGQGTQSLPVYAGVREVSSSANWVYIRSSGLASYVMGPWYLNAAKTQLFPSYPANAKVLYRFPRHPSVPTSKTLTGLGPVGYFVNGVSLFDNRDAFYWNGSSEVQGNGLWNRDAYVNESVTFDSALAHQAGSTHHYHANPIALRYQLADHVDYDAKSNKYSESAAAASAHSPILAWVKDGYPIYGPYGYVNPTNAASGVRRMTSGYVPRNGQNGTVNLTQTGRTSLPAWAARAYGRSTTLSASEAGPAVSSQYPFGRYIEDNDYLGDLGKQQGVDFDLDEYNGRFCVTPEFPQGTYAYFVSINANGAPVFPYNIGRSYYGNPTGGAVTSINESVTLNFSGGASSESKLEVPKVTAAGLVTMSWTAVEGGSYKVESSNDLSNWTVAGSDINAGSNKATATTTNVTAKQFYRVSRTNLAAYDTN